jgi:ATP-dependent Lhr-like helicase
MTKRQFRQIARVAGLIQPGFPGQRKSSRHLQASSNLFFDVFCQYDPDNLLLEQSRREVLEFQLESSRMFDAMVRIQFVRLCFAQTT